MSRDAIVNLEAARVVGDEVEVGATIEWPPMWPRFWKDRRQRVYVRLPADVAPSDHAIADSMLLASLFPAMRRARRIRIRATVSSDLLANATRLRDLWVERRPDKYGPVEIEPDGSVEAQAPTGPLVLPMSGGLDSSWSLRTLSARGSDGAPAALGLAVMIHGADIPLAECDAFGRAFERSRRIADAHGVRLARVTMNLRSLKQKWTHSCNAALGAVLTLFRGAFGGGRIATGYSAAEGPTWWPQDISDPPLLSCRAFPILGHGDEIDRPGKTRAVAGDAAIEANLRVCYRPGVYDRNCGRCLKCVTVLLMSKAVGDKTWSCFPRGATAEDVRFVAAGDDPFVWIRLAQFVTLARTSGHALDLADVAEAELARAGRGLDGLCR